MVIKYFLELLKSYKFSIIKVIIFELFYILRGYKGNSFSVTKNIKINNNIPCPYFLLHKINNFIKKRNIKSFIDLGCGSGRSIYFFNKKYKIHYFGIEYIDETYKKCKKMRDGIPELPNYRNIANVRASARALAMLRIIL